MSYDEPTISQKNVMISTSKLLRMAGASVLLAGICYIFVGVFHPPNLASSVTSARWAIVHVVACAMSFFAVLGLAGLYARQAERAGRLGLAGFVMLNLWFVLIMGFSFVEVFILPRMASADPRFVKAWMGMLTGDASELHLGVLATLWTLTAPLYMLSGLFFGIATFRAGIFPRGAGVLLAIGTMLAPVAGLLPNASQPKIAIPVGVALAWLGYALWSEPPAQTREVDSQQVAHSI